MNETAKFSELASKLMSSRTKSNKQPWESSIYLRQNIPSTLQTATLSASQFWSWQHVVSFWVPHPLKPLPQATHLLFPRVISSKYRAKWLIVPKFPVYSVNWSHSASEAILETCWDRLGTTMPNDTVLAAAVLLHFLGLPGVERRWRWNTLLHRPRLIMEIVEQLSRLHSKWIYGHTGLDRESSSHTQQEFISLQNSKLQTKALIQFFPDFEPTAVGVDINLRYGWVCLPSLEVLENFA